MKDARLKAVEQKSRINNKEPTVRLIFNDNTVKTVRLLEALDAVRADQDFNPIEPYPIKCEILRGYETAPQLCDVVKQVCERRPIETDQEA